MYTETDYSWIFIISAIILLILFIILFVNIIKISKNVVKIENQISRVGIRNDVYLKIHEGKIDEATEIVKKSFCSSCLNQLENDYYDYSSNTSKYDELIELYIKYYGDFLPDISTQYLENELLKLGKFYKHN